MSGKDPDSSSGTTAPDHNRDDTETEFYIEEKMARKNNEAEISLSNEDPSEPSEPGASSAPEEESTPLSEILNPNEEESPLADEEASKPLTDMLIPERENPPSANDEREDPLTNPNKPVEIGLGGRIPDPRAIHNEQAVADTLECDPISSEIASSSLAEVLEPTEENSTIPPHEAVLLKQAMADTIESKVDMGEVTHEHQAAKSIASDQPEPPPGLHPSIPSGFHSRKPSRVHPGKPSGPHSGGTPSAPPTRTISSPGSIDRGRAFLSEYAKPISISGFAALAVICILLLILNIKLSNGLAVVEQGQRDTEQKTAACKTALASYINSFRETEKERQSDQSTLSLHQKNLNSLAALIKRQGQLKRKQEEYQTKLDDSMTRVRGIKKKKGREFWKKFAKALAKRNHYKKKVEAAGEEIDTKIDLFRSEIDTQLKRESGVKTEQRHRGKKKS